jgi:trk system potassium uptake protein TrkH
MEINIRLILHLQGLLLIIIGIIMPTGLPFSLYYGDNDISSILQASLITILTGAGIITACGPRLDYTEIRKRESYLSVALSWILISAFGSLPFLLYGSVQTFTDAFFETMSGFTTTGASILTDVEVLPHGLLFWRSMTHWLGGMGIIVFSLAILPLLGVGGSELFSAEVSGPTKDKVHPQVAGTAKRLWAAYVILTVLNVIGLLLSDMNLFDALCHAFGTLGTGGFSTRNASLAAFSPAAQYVTTLFMFLAGVNFALHYHGILKGRLSAYFQDEEYRFYSIMVFCNVAFITLTIFLHSKLDMELSFRQAAFQVISIISSTGFVSADYEAFSPYTRYVFFILLFTGACAGSTTGAIKMVRLLVLSKNGILEFRRLLHPRAILPVRLNHRAVPPAVLHNILAFFALYMVVFLNGSLVLSVLGLNFETAMGAVAATLGCMGPGIGAVGPVANYAALPDLAKWILSSLMLLGRLELFTILIIFTPAYWKA